MSRFKSKRRARAQTPQLQITSLLDIMTVLLFFLLKSFGTTPELNISKNLELPKSVSTRPAVYALNIAVSKNEISVDGESIIALQGISKETKRLPQAVFRRDPDLIAPLFELLAKKRSYAAKLAKRDPLIKFKGDCIIQADQDTPFHIIKKVLYTAGQAGYLMLNVATLSTKDI